MSGFSRKDSNGTWNTGYLGAYAQGLGVTDVGEGNGSSNKHVIDNIGGYHDYVLLEFSNPVVIDQAYLDYVYNGDSDMAIWIGTKTNPYTTHNTLSDAFLTSLGYQENNDTTLTTSRWANVNAGNRSGNVIVIAASVTDTTPEDTFKLHKLMLGCPGTTPTPPPTATPTPTPAPTATPAPTPTPAPTCSAGTFVFEGNTATSGTLGNIRTYTVNGTTVKVSGFTRADSNGAWSTGYLGVYSHGLGVTNNTEGNGDNDRHTVDSNGGTRDYVLFEFSRSIVIDKAYLDYVLADSDMSAWIGSQANPSNHNTLSDSFLSSLGTREDNDTSTNGQPRWADINSAGKSGNILVISASASDTTPEDSFKIHKVVFGCCPTITVNPSSLTNGKKNTAYSQTMTASGSTSPYTFAKTSGSLPSGISLSSSGVLSGTPTATGTFTFTVTATSTSTGCNGSRSYSWVITN